ncbi:hypothetical protein PTTG_26479 [Puccinia triticina 1-1 BBBD Race 1]|uniref:Uncharacterized protein n=1 Tax=Puccinia triticina (isolate 1-1 / race 1 (BBBD)) TaxID=630390 RepID=A0A180GT79_PUCT1|nr:hypothetical protein PTTG_26479 [Puccinia triticina 1-1 BBBD Race 1]
MSLPLAGAQLKSMQELDEEWQNNASYKEPAFNEVFLPTTRRKGKQKFAEVQETLAPEMSVKQSRSNVNPPILAANQNPSRSSSQSNLQLLFTHSYALGRRKRALYANSEEEETAESEEPSGSDCMITGGCRTKKLLPHRQDKDQARILPEELDVVSWTILHTIVPSWGVSNIRNPQLEISQLAKNKIHCQWISKGALIPLWVKASEEAGTAESKNQIFKLPESTTTLSQITQFLTLPKIKTKDLSKLDDLILLYQKCLKEGWPAELSKPNLHLTQHYTKVIGRFGPPRSTAAWAQERVNGMLQKFPTNHHPDKIPKTLTHKWHMHLTLKSLLNGAALDKHLAEDQSDSEATKNKLRSAFVFEVEMCCGL